MSIVESLAQTKAGLRHLQMISSLTDADPLDGNGQVGVSALYQEAQKQSIPRVSLMSDLESLQNKGWIWFERSAAGIETIVLKQPGIDAADEFKALRTERRRRSREAQIAVLDWLYDLYLEDVEPTGIEDFLSNPKSQYFGGDYSARD